MRSMQPHPASEVHTFSEDHGQRGLLGDGGGTVSFELVEHREVPVGEQEMGGSREDKDVSRIGGKAFR